jgi:dihydroorotate dehydrogenase
VIGQRGRGALLRLYDASYRRLARPLIFRLSAQRAHQQMHVWLRRMDGQAWLLPLLGALRGAIQPPAPVAVGGTTLESPLILAAGLVKGDGFASEEEALAAVAAGRNVIPGWRCLPPLVGPVEFGSFTRWPRPGNSGVVTWRDVPTRSTQNRIGLRNPGARAAAAFLGARRARLPRQYGINIAVSPGVTDPAQQSGEVLASLEAFVAAGVIPTWFTLNLSCPNTEDDPRGRQTADEARAICAAALALLRETIAPPSAGAYCHTPLPPTPSSTLRGGKGNRPAASLPSPLVGEGPGMGGEPVPPPTGRIPPLWVKVGPNLSDDQYRALLRVLAETGVAAVVATNTLPLPAPDDPAVMAGVGGGRLHARAVEVAALLMAERAAHGYPLDVVACGGVQDGATLRAFAGLGISAMQYWTALVYRGPLASALLAYERER